MSSVREDRQGDAMNYEVNEYHTTLKPDQRGRLTLRPYLREIEGGFQEYRVHPYRDGSILLRPAPIQSGEAA